MAVICSDTLRMFDPIGYALDSPPLREVMFESEDEIRTYSFQQHIWRVLDPLTSEFRALRPSELVFYNRYWDSVTRLIANNFYQVDFEPLLMFIDGVCEEMADKVTVAACGVYLGQGSHFNRAGCLPRKLSQTVEMAEIVAAQQAVLIARRQLIPRRLCKSGVVIVTHSYYLFQAITNYIYFWLRMDGPDLECHPEANCDAILDLHLSIATMEAAGISIRFWRVLRDDNCDAHSLARQALQHYHRAMLSGVLNSDNRRCPSSRRHGA